MNMNMIDRPMVPGRCRGFTLVELLVAMVISAALMVGIVQVFMSSKATYRVVENLSRIQENGRFAMDTISFNVRMAGYRGCRSTSTTEFDNSLNDGETSALYNFKTGIEGFDAVNSQFNDSYLRNALNFAIEKAADDEDAPMTIELIPANSGAHDEPDAVVVRAVFGSPVRLHPDSCVSNSGDDLCKKATPEKRVEWHSTINNACPDGSDMQSGLCEGDVVMISDCNKARAFQIANFSQLNPSRGRITMVHGNAGSFTPGNAEHQWSGYRPGSEIVKVGTRIYFIANYVDRNNNRIPSLFVLDEYGRAELLAAGVEDMQIYYGVDTNPSEYMLRSDRGGLIEGRWPTANQIESDPELEWEQVVNAEIRLLMRSEENFLTPDGQPQRYPFDQGWITPPNGDARLRREFVSTITVRNRALF